MTFYQELQVNQAGSKKIIRESASQREKLYHIAVYLTKIAITVAFCFVFVSLYSLGFGADNSIVGVVVLLYLLVFRSAHLCIRTGQSHAAARRIFRHYGRRTACSQSGWPGRRIVHQCCCDCPAHSVRLPRAENVQSVHTRARLSAAVWLRCGRARLSNAPVWTCCRCASGLRGILWQPSRQCL